MKRLHGKVSVTILLVAFPCLVRADDAEATAVLNKAIKAIGGEERLAKADTVTWQINQSVMGSGIAPIFCTAHCTMQGLDRSRVELEIENNGKLSKTVSILNGDNYWTKSGDTGAASKKLDGAELAEAKRAAYLEIIPMTLLPLKRNKAFEIALHGEEKVGSSQATILRVTGPEGKDFKLFIDNQSGLPVKMEVVAAVGFTMVTNYYDYKEVDGIKWPTKIRRTTKEIFTPHPVELRLSKFQVLKNVAPETFVEPR